MLPVPNKYFTKSVFKHNVRTDILCDWVEGSLLFDETREFISQIHVADALLADERYVEQDFAMEGVKNGWLELRRRNGWSGQGSGINLAKQKIVRDGTWRKFPAYSFCLLISLAPFYDWWIEDEYVEQGEIFELLTKESFEAQFPSWRVIRTGWSRSNTAQLRDVAIAVATELHEDIGDLDTWHGTGKKEMGLDLLCYRPFSDKRRGIPVYMMQCASGSNWDIKLHTPDLNRWTDIIHFKNEPVKAFSTPFTFPDQIYNQCIASVRGLFMERCRLLSASSYKLDWMSQDLKDRIISWCEPRVQSVINRTYI